MKKPSVRAQVLAYVMQNPSKTRMEIAKGMGYDHKSIALALKHWQMEGKIFCKAAGKDSTWSAVVEASAKRVNSVFSLGLNS